MEEFIKQLLQDKGVPADMDESVRRQLETDLTSRATDMINKRLIDSMDETTLAQFEKLLNEQPDDVQAVQNFIESNVPDKETLTAAALLEFRALYLGEKA